MKTTIDACVGRRDNGCTEESVEETLDSARRILADVSSVLETEVERLFHAEVDSVDEARIRTVMDLIKQTQAAVLRVLDIRQKLGADPAHPEHRTLDLEAARAEIASRLARLAE